MIAVSGDDRNLFALVSKPSLTHCNFLSAQISKQTGIEVNSN